MSPGHLRTRTAGIVIHHAAGPEQLTAADYDRDHDRRGWLCPVSRADYEDEDPPEWVAWSADGTAVVHLGYHALVLPSGVVELGRPWTAIGSHCQAASRNLTHVGVCLAGDRELRPMPAAQRTALVEVLAGICGRFELDPRAQTLERDRKSVV